MNPSSGQVAGNSGSLSTQRMIFGFRITFQITMTKSSMEPSPGPSTPQTKSPSHSMLWPPL